MNSPARLSCFALTALLLAACEMPPRHAWQAIRREGLITYLGSPTPGYSSSRYLESSGKPFGSMAYRDTRPAPARVNMSPYRLNTKPSRYLDTDNDRTITAYRAPVKRSSPKREIEPEPKEHIDPIGPVAKTTPSSEEKEKSTATTSTNDSTVAVKPSSPATDALPYGSPVAGRPGMVTSPYANKQQLVDIAGMSTGQTVKCPYTGKLFRVPPTEQAAAKSTESPAVKAPEEPKVTPQ